MIRKYLITFILLLCFIPNGIIITMMVTKSNKHQLKINSKGITINSNKITLKK